MLTLGSFFDGSGGFPLAAKLSGIKPVWISELIQKLWELKQDYGDLECGFYSEENDGNFEEPPECYYRPLTSVEYVHEQDVTLNRNEDYDNLEIINLK